MTGPDIIYNYREKQQLEEELSMYKRMAVQQRMDNAYKSSK